MSVLIRPATSEDALFVAQVMLLAARSQLTRGIWDITLARPEQECLMFLKELAHTETRSWGHHSGFIIAEVNGQSAAGLCGYNPVEAGIPALAKAIEEAATKVGWGSNDVAAIWERYKPVATCISDDAEGAWIVENVATLPPFRRRGLVNQLLETMLERGRERGHRIAQISILIGNTPAQKAY
ncbi:MAG: GNAT family N-acetyltransferase, partial [Acidobacteriota bacterium]